VHGPHPAGIESRVHGPHPASCYSLCRDSGCVPVSHESPLTAGRAMTKKRRVYKARRVDGEVMLDLEHLHKYMSEVEAVEFISDPVREVVKELWPELVHKLPPKRPQSWNDVMAPGAEVETALGGAKASPGLKAASLKRSGVRSLRARRAGEPLSHREPSVCFGERSRNILELLTER